MQKRTSKVIVRKPERPEDAVSPVVGVMLLLVVTVIIAAVVATFASGLVSTQQAAPTVAADVEILSLDSYATYGAAGKFEMKIVAVSDDVPTKDLKLVTKYVVNSRDNSEEKVSGGATVYGKVNNTKYTGYEYVSPIGFGPGVQGSVLTGGQYNENQQFGYYSLTEGTYMQNTGAYNYGQVDELIGAPDYWTDTALVIKNMYKGNALDAILGEEWTHLQPGDTVDVTLIHVPTNGVLFSKTVTVE